MIRVSNGARNGALARIFVGSCLLFCILAAPISVAADPAPDVLVREIFDDLFDQLDVQRDAGALTHGKVREIFASLLNPRIDYLSLARWIMRDHWVNSSDEQRSAFLEAFKAYIINTYALALADGKEIHLDIEGNPVLKKNTAVVMATFGLEDEEPAPLDFRLIQREGKWLLFDVSVTGVSLARTFRSDFTYVAKDGGIDAVTAHLVRRREGSD